MINKLGVADSCVKRSGDRPLLDPGLTRLRRWRVGVAAGAVLAAGAVAGGLALAPVVQAAEKIYTVMITDVPSGVRSVGVATNHGYLGCFAVAHGGSVSTGGVAYADDSVTAQWFSDGGCRTDTGHVSQAIVPASSLTNFWFRLAANQKK